MTIINIGNQSMTMDIPQMLIAFKSITNCEEKGFYIVKKGLDAIQDLVNFLNKTSQNSTIGYLSKKDILVVKIQHLRKAFREALFIRSGGKVDLFENNILQPQETRSFNDIITSLKINILGKKVLLDLDQELVEPFLETLKEVEDTILAHIMVGVKIIDDEERKIYQTLENNANPLSDIEIKSRTGSYIPGFELKNSNLKYNLINESQQIKRPRDMEKTDYQVLLDILEEITQKREFLMQIKTTSEVFPSFGLKSAL